MVVYCPVLSLLMAVYFPKLTLSRLSTVLRWPWSWLSTVLRWPWSWLSTVLIALILAVYCPYRLDLDCLLFYDDFDHGCLLSWTPTSTYGYTLIMAINCLKYTLNMVVYCPVFSLIIVVYFPSSPYRGCLLSLSSSWSWLSPVFISPWPLLPTQYWPTVSLIMVVCLLYWAQFD